MHKIFAIATVLGLTFPVYASNMQDVLETAAASIDAGTYSAVPDAIDASLVTNNFTVEQWCAAIEDRNDPQKFENFFVVYEVGPAVPKVYADNGNFRMLGECNLGLCTVASASNPDCKHEYTYQCTPQVNIGGTNYRYCHIVGLPYFSGGWRLTCVTETYCYWLGSWLDVPDSCVTQTGFTLLQCSNLIKPNQWCWTLDQGIYSGQNCRQGWVVGEDAVACPNGDIGHGLPCIVDTGAGSEVPESEKVWTGDDMKVARMAAPAKLKAKTKFMFSGSFALGGFILLLLFMLNKEKI